MLDESGFDSFYVMKLDDVLMCGVYVSTSLADKTPEYYEALFD